MCSIFFFSFFSINNGLPLADALVCVISELRRGFGPLDASQLFYLLTKETERSLRPSTVMDVMVTMVRYKLNLSVCMYVFSLCFGNVRLSLSTLQAERERLCIK